MPTTLKISPAASGKTTTLADRVLERAVDLSTRVRVIVPGYPQVRAWRRLLAKRGGVIGVQVLTFPQLYQQVLDAGGKAYTRLSTPVQYRLLQSILDDMELVHYATLKDKPGLVLAFLNVITELKVGRNWPDKFAAAVQDLGAEPRFVELARVYTAYQDQMLENNWADRAGMGWLTAEVLEADTHLCQDWSILYIDGFDDLTPVQIDVVRLLAQRIPDVIITLTGDVENPDRLVHRRYVRTRDRLTKAIDKLNVECGRVFYSTDRNPALTHLESTFLTDATKQYSPCSGIDLIAAPNREAEVRIAMRWLKQRVVYDGMSPGDIGLLARSIEPYRHFIRQTAEEFGMPIHMVHDVPLAENPCVAILLDLLSLSVDDYPRQRTIDVWFSPYFDWNEALNLDSQTFDRVQHSRMLHAAALWGKVIGGYEQWCTALEELSTFDTEEKYFFDDELSTGYIPVSAEAEKLLNHFKQFTEYLRPPEGVQSYRQHVQWVENIIGGYSEDESESVGDSHSFSSLRLIDNVFTGPPELRQRDFAALQAFKDVLRGFVWAEQIISRADVDYPTFFRDLVRAIASANYHLPLPVDREAILVSDVSYVRSISFDAVTVLGLAEGEFPTTVQEDAFLPDTDRRRLRNLYGLRFDLSSERYEVGYFYDAITRPSTHLLLTRPRLTDTGADWQPSPFWLEVQRLVDVEPINYISDSVPDVKQLSSQSEAVYYGALRNDGHFARWVQSEMPSRWSSLKHAAHLLKIRLQRIDDVRDEYDGNLTAYHTQFTGRYGPDHVWSASRLESYSTCPFMFFTGSVLELEPREEPEEGFDARQLGNIYHHIFESLYKAVDDPADLEQLLAMLSSVADKILDEAPQKEQFRQTAWWIYNRQEIKENVRKSLEALCDLPGDFRPYAYEQPFGLYDAPLLVVKDDQDRFCVRGYIDRVDLAPDGSIRIIDYKTSGPYEFTASSVRQGKKLQLPLYALAARDALNLGYPEDGFYWHVRDSEASSFTLAKFGPETAIKCSVDVAWKVIRAVRSGDFSPIPPRGGCPRYCPASDICWQYQAGYY